MTFSLTIRNVLNMIKHDLYFNKVESLVLDMPETLTLEALVTLAIFLEISLVQIKDVDHDVVKIYKQTPQSLFASQYPEQHFHFQLKADQYPLECQQG